MQLLLVTASALIMAGNRQEGPPGAPLLVAGVAVMLAGAALLLYALWRDRE